MIKLVVSGIFGRMGKEIISLSVDYEDITIIAGFDKDKDDTSIPVEKSVAKLPREFDVAVDFSSPEAAMDMLSYCMENEKPFVTGTTGFSDEQEKEIQEISGEIPVFKASNMSMGISTVISILKNLPDMIFEDFDIEIVESHHRFKKDSPSGTARTLGKIIAKRIGKEKFSYGRKEKDNKREKGEIGLHSIRGGTVVGTHNISFLGNDESEALLRRL